VSAIGSAERHTDVLENPDVISKTVLARRLDSNTAFEIVSIDIADIDVGANIGARLQADQAEADTRVARAKAEGRRAMAVAKEQEMIAGIDQTLAHSDVPNNAIASGDYATLVMHRLTEQWNELLLNALLFGFETLPLMLIGVALYRMGFFSGAFDRATLLRWGWIGVIAGGLVHLAIGLVVQAGGFTYFGTLSAFVAWSPLPRLWMVLGMAALLVAYAPSATGWLGERVRAAGQRDLLIYGFTGVKVADEGAMKAIGEAWR
jgi:hypothetical protein